MISHHHLELYNEDCSSKVIDSASWQWIVSGKMKLANDYLALKGCTSFVSWVKQTKVSLAMVPFLLTYPIPLSLGTVSRFQKE